MNEQTTAPRWEICEIRLKTHGLAGVGFQAIVMGPAGSHVRAETRRFLSYSPYRGQRAAVEQIMSELAAEGWQPLPSGGRLPWWNYRFQRPISVRPSHVAG